MKFEVITKNFEDALVRYKVACQRDWQFVVNQQSRIVGEKLIKFTPPKTASIGKRNVARDIGKVFADLSGTTWEDKSLNKMWRAGNFEGVKKALESHPNKSEMPIFKYKRIFKSPVRNIHKAAINKRGKESLKSTRERYNFRWELQNLAGLRLLQSWEERLRAS